MRCFGLPLLSLALSAAVLQAQQASPPPQQNVARAQELDAHLLKWEQQMQFVKGIQAQCIRVEKDKVIQETQVFEGVAKFMKPNLAKLEMQNKRNPQMYEKYVFTGTNLYEFKPSVREIWVHQLPPAKPGQVADDNFLSFLFGMKADEAKRKYVLNLGGTDQWYVYIEISPRFAKDKQDFSRARLVLNKQTYLPRQLWFVQPNGSEVTWDIPRIDARVELDRREFDYPALPQGWKMKDAPKQPDSNQNVPPRVVRPNR